MSVSLFCILCTDIITVQRWPRLIVNIFCIEWVIDLMWTIPSCCLQSFGLSDVIGCFLDLDSCTVKWSKNGIISLFLVVLLSHQSVSRVICAFNIWHSCLENCTSEAENIYRMSQKIIPSDSVEISAVRGNIWMEFHTTVKKENVCFITNFCRNICENN